MLSRSGRSERYALWISRVLCTGGGSGTSSGTPAKETCVVGEIILPHTLYSTEKDRALFQRYLDEIRALSASRQVAPEEYIIHTARFFLDAHYVSATLEKEPDGVLVNLREFDFTTFVATVLALSYTEHHASPSWGVVCD